MTAEAESSYYADNTAIRMLRMMPPQTTAFVCIDRRSLFRSEVLRILENQTSLYSSSFSTYLCRISFHCRCISSQELLVTKKTQLCYTYTSIVGIPYFCHCFVEAAADLSDHSWRIHLALNPAMTNSHISKANAPTNTVARNTAFLRNRVLHQSQFEILLSSSIKTYLYRAEAILRAWGQHWRKRTNGATYTRHPNRNDLRN